MEPATQAAALQHAIEASPAESCGLVVVVKGRERYVPCRNISEEPVLFFQIHPHDYARAEDLGPITAVVHSHPASPALPAAKVAPAWAAPSVRSRLVHPRSAPNPCPRAPAFYTAHAH